MPKRSPADRNLYKRGNRWYCRLIVNGREVRRSIADDKDAAKAIMTALRSRRDLAKLGLIADEEAALDVVTGNGATDDLAELYRMFSRHIAEIGRSASTQYAVESAWRNLIERQHMKVLADVTLNKVLAWERRKAQAGVKGQSTNIVIQKCRFLFEWALKRKLIKYNPLAEWGGGRPRRRTTAGTCQRRK